MYSQGTRLREPAPCSRLPAGISANEENEWFSLPTSSAPSSFTHFTLFVEQTATTFPVLQMTSYQLVSWNRTCFQELLTRQPHCGTFA